MYIVCRWRSLKRVERHETQTSLSLQYCYICFAYRRISYIKLIAKHTLTIWNCGGTGAPAHRRTGAPAPELVIPMPGVYYIDETYATWERKRTEERGKKRQRRSDIGSCNSRAHGTPNVTLATSPIMSNDSIKSHELCYTVLWAPYAHGFDCLLMQNRILEKVIVDSFRCFHFRRVFGFIPVFQIILCQTLQASVPGKRLMKGILDCRDCMQIEI